MDELFQEGDRLCQGTILLRELTLRTRDAILSFGERLSALLVAAALAEHGVASEAIEATELIVTDACHGCADPLMDLTRDRCEARLRPLLIRHYPGGDRIHRSHCERVSLLLLVAAVRITPRRSWARPFMRTRLSSGRMWMACRRPTRDWCQAGARSPRSPIEKPPNSPILARRCFIRKLFER